MNLPSTFTYNGMLKTNEIAGEGNSYDFGARMHDGRLGRWLSIDPCEMKFPSLSPYNFAANNPIYYVDKDGRIIKPWGDIASINLFVAQIQKSTSMKVEYDVLKNEIIIRGKPMNERDEYLLKASFDYNVTVNIYLTNSKKFIDRRGSSIYLLGGSFCGSEINNDGTVSTTQWVNPFLFKQIESLGYDNSGVLASHELIESYIGAQLHPGFIPTSRSKNQEPSDQWKTTHDETNKVSHPIGGIYYDELNDNIGHFRNQINDEGELKEVYSIPLRVSNTTSDIQSLKQVSNTFRNTFIESLKIVNRVFGKSDGKSDQNSGGSKENDNSDNWDHRDNSTGPSVPEDHS
jgi:RHS repeat-associated protein